MNTAKVIIQLITALTNLVVIAFEEKDVKKLRRVTDVLTSSDSVLAARAIMELEKEKARAEFEAAFVDASSDTE